MSNLIDHAERELRHLLTHDDPMEREVAESVLAAVRGFASFDGHSGGSAMVAIHWLNELLNFRAIGPLTDDPAEWMDLEQTGPGFPGLWQSRRTSEAFSEDGGRTYYLLSEDRRTRFRRRLKRDVHAHTSVPHA